MASLAANSGEMKAIKVAAWSFLATMPANRSCGDIKPPTTENAYACGPNGHTFPMYRLGHDLAPRLPGRLLKVDFTFPVSWPAASKLACVSRAQGIPVAAQRTAPSFLAPGRRQFVTCLLSKTKLFAAAPYPVGTTIRVELVHGPVIVGSASAHVRK
jgi:hypothetical protein